MGQSVALCVYVHDCIVLEIKLYCGAAESISL